MGKGWTRGDVIALCAFFIAVVGIPIAFFTPELRRKVFGSENPPINVEVKCSLTSCPDETNSSTINAPRPSPIIKPSPKLESAEDSFGDIHHYALVDTRNDTGLYIQKTRDVSSERVALVPESEQVEVLSCENKNVVVNARLGSWCRIRYNNTEGWGFGPYMGIFPQTSSIDGSNDSNEDYIYIADTRNDSGLNLRKYKDLSSESLVFAEEGEEVEMIYCEEELITLEGREGRWCWVMYDGVEGWAWGWFLNKQPRNFGS